jgi:hypothetical protein
LEGSGESTPINALSEVRPNNMAHHLQASVSFMDRSYKEDIPKTRRALEELRKEFSGVASTTDWTKLRIEPLLDHVKSLERLLRSPKFARETARLRRGVVMFHSDLVYLRENVKALKTILEIEKRTHRRRLPPNNSAKAKESRPRVDPVSGTVAGVLATVPRS